jgi:hypothetical protein
MNDSLFLPVITTPYKRMSGNPLKSALKLIYSCMNGNIYFPTLADEVAAFGEVVTAFVAQMALADMGGINAIETKREMRSTITALTIALGDSVKVVAGMDMVMLTSSGFPLKRINQRITLKQAGNLSVKGSTNPGELKIKTDIIYGGRVYNIKYAIAPISATSTWHSSCHSTCKRVLTGLQAGSRYMVQVTIIGARKQSCTTIMQISPLVQ